MDSGSDQPLSLSLKGWFFDKAEANRQPFLYTVVGLPPNEHCTVGVEIEPDGKHRWWARWIRHGTEIHIGDPQDSPEEALNAFAKLRQAYPRGWLDHFG